MHIFDILIYWFIIWHLIIFDFENQKLKLEKCELNLYSGLGVSQKMYGIVDWD